MNAHPNILFLFPNWKEQKVYRKKGALLNMTEMLTNVLKNTLENKQHFWYEHKKKQDKHHCQLAIRRTQERQQSTVICQYTISIVHEISS